MCVVSVTKNLYTDLRNSKHLTFYVFIQIQDHFQALELNIEIQDILHVLKTGICYVFYF